MKYRPETLKQFILQLFTISTESTKMAMNQIPNFFALAARKRKQTSHKIKQTKRV